MISAFYFIMVIFWAVVLYLNLKAATETGNKLNYFFVVVATGFIVYDLITGFSKLIP